MTEKPKISQTNIRYHVDHIALSVTDLKESETFYRDVLGLKQIPEPFKRGRHVWFDLGGAQLHVVRATDERRDHEFSDHFCFCVDDIEAFIERIARHEITYFDTKGNEGVINIRPDGVKQIYFQDPDGYWVEVNNAF